MKDPFQAWVVRRDSEPGALAFGVKDVIDVSGFPTAHGVDYATTYPHVDAWCVSALRTAGMVPIGKTHTTPFALRDPAVTRNPRDPSRSPGGSSAGSAAAVAAGDVPFALGTQTGGSVLRPAAYCGVLGYKPTWGRIPTVGVAPSAPSLDTIGIIAADVGVARRAAEALIALDDAVPASPRLGVALDYLADFIEPATRAVVERAVAMLRGVMDVVDVRLPACVEESVTYGAQLHAAETWIACGAWLRDLPVPACVEEVLDQGRAIDTESYHAIRRWRELHRPTVTAIFERIDALIVPANNVAPEFGSTGDPAPFVPWTFFGLPAISLPIGAEPNTGLPLAMQIVAPYGADGLLLDVAASIERALPKGVLAITQRR